MLDRTAPGVYTVTGSADTWHRRLTVGLLALGERSWVSHEAAARLHRFDRAIDEAVEFTVERQGRGRRMPFTVHTTSALQRIDCVTVDGFRCLSATRTIIDLARARVPAVRLEAAIDSAVRQGLVGDHCAVAPPRASSAAAADGVPRHSIASSSTREVTRCSSASS